MRAERADDGATGGRHRWRWRSARPESQSPGSQDRGAGGTDAGYLPGDHRGADPVIDVRGAGVRYGQVRALREASLAVGPGRICALVGMNGSGKSTLMKVMLGLVRPHPGQVLINGTPPSSARRAGGIAYVPQREEVDWNFPVSVRDVVSTGRYARLGRTRRLRTADRDLVAEALQRVDLAEFAGRQVGQLSGGQRKRAFVARAIAQQAPVLLLDEPFAGVDERSQQTISALLRSMADAGATIVISTHDLPALPALADEAALLAGTVLMHGDPAEVIRPENLARAFGLGQEGAP